jgi:Fe-S oxidoreductase
MLGLARRRLRHALDVLAVEIQAGTPIVALEPSCGAVFRHELTQMLPHDENAKRLARQTLSFGELLAHHARDWEMPALRRSALVHFHCHQRATSDTDCDKQVFDRLGLNYEIVQTGCCGLAGSFGYEAGERYEVSVAAGERTLLPAVRAASPHTLLVSDGFSCRSQIEHGSDRSSLHLAQAVQMAMREGPNGPGVERPERRYHEPPSPVGGRGRARRRAAVGAAAGAAVAAGTWAAARRPGAAAGRVRAAGRAVGG